MTVDEVVKFVDQMVFEKTGKHLDDIQTAVVEGTWKRETYDQIAREYNLSSSHVGDVGSELWQLLSKILHEDIKKTNFCSTLERVYYIILTHLKIPIFIVVGRILILILVRQY
ncbi:hypothetical protein [Anabaena sp. UHCC 0204]|uniref:hypothetical protein n=1 Tax=Anabaena sp. UHCC 0204 TaxID=2590009 RepID=UPI001C2C6D11|nr:hypothetical protein [Anabaena sp. UHCC 0204]